MEIFVFLLDLFSVKNRIGRLLLPVMLLVEMTLRLERIGCCCVALRTDERKVPNLLVLTGR